MSEFGFKVPVSGQKIPHGWFAALVRFINSLILSGDGTWTQVDRDENGTHVTLTNYAINSIKRAAGGPPGAGAAQDLSVSVSGNTVSVGISGSTSHVDFVAGNNINITGNTNGQVEINATGGTGGGSAYPAWGDLVAETLSQVWDAANEHLSPIVLAASGYLYIYCSPQWLLDETHQSRAVDLVVYVDNQEVFRFQRDSLIQAYTPGDPVPIVLSDYLTRSDMIPVCSGSSVTATWDDSDNDTPPLVLTLYRDTGSAPPPDYTVTSASGTTNGSLFYGLSQRGSNNVLIDSSLDGQPIDFEGASVL